MAPTSERKPRNNARKSAARQLQRKNPGMAYKEALSLTPSPDSLAIRRFLHRSEQLSAALENVEHAVFRDMRVRRSAPENPYLTVELDGMGELTRLWFAPVARHTPEQIGAMTMAAIAECYHALGECQRHAMDAATLANGLPSRHREDELWRVPDWSAAAPKPDADVDNESLASQIVAVAGLARAKYRMELRLWALAHHKAEGRALDHFDRIYRVHRRCPTPEEYQALEGRVFASGSA